jgi:hypothetical protein
MRPTISILLIACSFLALGQPIAAADKARINRRTGLFEPPVGDLRQAAERGDRADLSRIATRLGPARLGRLLGEVDRKIVLAALEAAPLLDASILLLDAMPALLASSDATVRAQAVASTAGILVRSDPLRLSEYEVPMETLLATCRALASIAAQDSEQLGTRLAAIQGALDGGPTCIGQLRLDPLLTSRERDIRQAAVWAVPEAAEPGTAALLSAATRDSESSVAGAAAARLCAWPGGKPALARPLHELVHAEGVLVEDLVDLLPCLASSSDPADAKALAELGEAGRAPVREAVKRLREARALQTAAESAASKPGSRAGR